MSSAWQDESLIALRWAAYQNYLSKIDAIRGFKEEVYQDGFFKDVFEACLGYTLKTTNPADYNLEREKKNETDGKKADGVIVVDGRVIGVIELKDQKSKNLDAVEAQAFNYHASHAASQYVIISNFDELRFYVDKKTAYEKFSLFNLTYEEFKILHLLLSFESIRDNVPQKLKEKSSHFEQTISKALYRDFSAFRIRLFENIVKNNHISVIPAQAGVQLDSRLRGNDEGIDKQTLLRLTQKLCDRIVFILFAEDRGLLRSNTIREIREEFHAQKFTDYALYDIYKFYFRAISEGNPKLDIPSYNGGLFAADELLDSLVIEDEYLDMEAQNLSDFDFESDISVNILGHIFEQSLTDLEEMNAQVNDEAFDKKKSKRKKDGVFYTPEYITRYIVENTLGKLCAEKKTALGIDSIGMPENAKKLTKSEKETLANLYAYRDWLLNLKILDPACGSGAFLNQALEFLIREHRNVDEYRRAYENEALSLYDIETNILEHNLYGVDINEDAVEIARLSLWLRTAQKGRALTNLSDKIVCANSLLAMPFKENSFDVVIGNPPYVRVQGLKSNYEDESKLYEAKYQSAVGKYDIYALFVEMSFKMLKPSGKLSYILPHKFLIADFGRGLRGFLSENRAVESLLHFGSEMVFEDASTYTCILTLSHDNEILRFKAIKPNDIFDELYYDEINYSSLGIDNWNLSSNEVGNILEKINQQPLKVKDVFSDVYRGIVSGSDDIFILQGKIQNQKFIGFSKALDCEIEIESEIVRKLLKGQGFKRYENPESDLYILYPHKLQDGKTKPYEEVEFEKLFPLAYQYVLTFKKQLIDKKIKYKTNPTYWYSLHNSREISNFEQEKLIVPYLTVQSQFILDNKGLYFNDKCSGLIKKKNEAGDYKFYLALFNSALMWFFIKHTSAEFSGGFYVYSNSYINPFPLPKLELEQQNPFSQKTDLMLEFNKQLQTAQQNFFNELHLEKIPQKLQNFEVLEFDEFVKEYTKAKKIKFADKLEERNFKNDWSALFEHDKKAVLDLKEQIAKTDKEIDAMVYALYGLNEDEIAVVEGRS